MPSWREDGVLRLLCDRCKEHEATYPSEGNWDEARLAEVQAEEDGWVLKGGVICPKCAPFDSGYSLLRVP
jgi:hypothetical protein